MNRCIDCAYCDIDKALCRIGDKIYNLQDDDLWTPSECEFFDAKENNEENN